MPATQSRLKQKQMRTRATKLDENAAFAGILLGLVLGALYTLLRSKRSGRARRRDLTALGAATAKAEMEASIDKAKSEARARLDEES